MQLQVPGSSAARQRLIEVGGISQKQLSAVQFDWYQFRAFRPRTMLPLKATNSTHQQRHWRDCCISTDVQSKLVCCIYTASLLRKDQHASVSLNPQGIVGFWGVSTRYCEILEDSPITFSKPQSPRSEFLQNVSISIKFAEKNHLVESRVVEVCVVYLLIYPSKTTLTAHKTASRSAKLRCSSAALRCSSAALRRTSFATSSMRCPEGGVRSTTKPSARGDPRGPSWKLLEVQIAAMEPWVQVLVGFGQVRRSDPRKQGKEIRRDIGGQHFVTWGWNWLRVESRKKQETRSEISKNGMQHLTWRIGMRKSHKVMISGFKPLTQDSMMTWRFWCGQVADAVGLLAIVAAP